MASKVESITNQIEALSPADLATLRRWFQEFDWIAWDAQWAEDAQSGKLDKLAERALQSHKPGKSTTL